MENKKRFLDEEIMEDFITFNFKSISDFCRKLGVSRSHFDGMMKGKIACGIKTREKLMNLLNDYEVNLEDVLEPLPIIIGEKSFKEIQISDKDGNLIASINSNNEISDKNFKVEYIPFD
jgi:hypothetical protein